MKTIRLSILCIFLILMNCSSDDSSEDENQLPMPIAELVIFANSPQARAFDITIPYLGKNCESLDLNTNDISETDISIQVWRVNLGNVSGFEQESQQYSGATFTEFLDAELVINGVNYIATHIEFDLSFTPFEEFTCFAGNGFSGSLMNATINLTLVPSDANNGNEEIEVVLSLTNIQVVNDCAC